MKQIDRYERLDKLVDYTPATIKRTVDLINLNRCNDDEDEEDF